MNTLSVAPYAEPRHLVMSTTKEKIRLDDRSMEAMWLLRRCIDEALASDVYVRSAAIREDISFTMHFNFFGAKPDALAEVLVSSEFGAALYPLPGHKTSASRLKTNGMYMVVREAVIVFPGEEPIVRSISIEFTHSSVNIKIIKRVRDALPTTGFVPRSNY